jgi:putative two-component system response regulator
MVLVLADEAGSQDRLLELLGRGRFPAAGVATVESALTRLRHAAVRPSVVVASLGGGAIAGFLEQARGIDPDLGAVVVPRGLPAVSERPWAFRGVSVLVDPIEAEELRDAVDFQLRRRIERVAEAETRRILGPKFEARVAEVERKLERFATASLEVLVTALEARDPFFSGHSQRVAQLSASLADATGHSEEEIETVRLAGRLHDIGMLWVSDRVVHKEGPLAPAEREQIQQHPVVGCHILTPYPHLSEVRRFVRGHHERWDGTGYPDTLIGAAIPWGARIIAVAESYDAMVTTRAHRRDVLSRSEATREIQRLGGTAFDPAVVEALAGLVGGRRTLDFVPDQSREVAVSAPLPTTAA